MISTTLTLSNKLGLHARASAKLVKLASGFKSHIEIGHDDELVNAKSIMGVMMLAAGYGTELTLKISGADEQEALDAISDLFERKFDEES